jgi:hypothetical protein
MLPAIFGRTPGIALGLFSLDLQVRSRSSIRQLAFINAVGPSAGESGFGSIAGFPYTAPCEDLTAEGVVASVEKSLNG